MIIRNATKTDFAGLLEIGDSIYQSIQNKAQFNWPREVLAKELDSVSTIIVESGGDIVSFVCYRELPDQFEVSVLATQRLRQKKGFQKVLIQFLQALAAKQRKSIVLEVHQENAAATGLYQKLGFVLLHTRKKYYSDQADASVMSWDSNKAGC